MPDKGQKRFNEAVAGSKAVVASPAKAGAEKREPRRTGKHVTRLVATKFGNRPK